MKRKKRLKIKIEQGMILFFSCDFTSFLNSSNMRNGSRFLSCEVPMDLWMTTPAPSIWPMLLNDFTTFLILFIFVSFAIIPNINEMARKKKSFLFDFSVFFFLYFASNNFFYFFQFTEFRDFKSLFFSLKLQKKQKK